MYTLEASNFWTGVTAAITNIMSSFSTVASDLMGNEIFQIMFAVVIVTLLIGITVGLAKGVKGRRKRR